MTKRIKHKARCFCVVFLNAYLKSDYSIQFNSHNLLAIKHFLLQYCYGTIIFDIKKKKNTVLQYYSIIINFTHSFQITKLADTYTTIDPYIFKWEWQLDWIDERLRSPRFLFRRLPPAVTWKYKVLTPLFVTLPHTLPYTLWHISIIITDSLILHYHFT